MKVLFSDMDGTIIDFNEMKHPHDKEMLKELKKQGHLIAFNTGRNYQEAHNCIRKHEFPFDYLILNNGAHIVNKEGKEIFKKIIPQHIGRSIIEFSMKIPDMYVFFYDGNRTLGYCNQKTFEHATIGNIEINDVNFVDEYLKVKEFDIIAVHQINEQTEDILKVQKYIADNFSEYAHGCLNTHYLDITAVGCTKGSGVLALKDLLHEKVETYCIGDSYNDISMFELSDHAYTFHTVNEDISNHADKQVDYVYEVIEDMLGGTL
ncbi:MAG: HAD family hydrolase [Coprobacillus sp.]